ncbi:MAG: hypothetical protein V1738_06125, partial [Patescibacteria group bacterium]
CPCTTFFIMNMVVQGQARRYGYRGSAWSNAVWCGRRASLSRWLAVFFMPPPVCIYGHAAIDVSGSRWNQKKLTDYINTKCHLARFLN